MSRTLRLTAVEVFDEASRLPPSERQGFLDGRCAGDSGLKSEVQSLLEQLDEEPGFLSKALFDKPILDPAQASLAPAGPDLAPGTRLASYTIRGILGRGGMGTVYLAQQDNPRREVALKIVRPGAVGPALLKRFRREAQLLGRLQHPGIAQIFEAGVADIGAGVPQPFLAMELVRGRPLTEYASAHSLDTRARLSLIAQICDAIEHAHQRGMIHRDLKPANILVDEQGEKGGAAQPKVLDFGVARAIDQPVSSHTTATDAGQLVGTLAYMSPEQVAPDGRPLDARSDVYALGVVLHELLVGALPHEIRGRTILDAVRIIRDEEPTRLSTVGRAYRGDIETIVLKSLARERDRRYPSAAAMAADIRRYLAGEPITARQDSALYILNKKLRRYRWAVAAGLVFLLLIAGFGVWSAVQARAFATLARSEAAAKLDAQDQERQTKDQLRLSNIERGRIMGANSDMRAAEDLLWPALAANPESRDAYWALWELYARFPCIRAYGGHGTAIYGLQLNPDSTVMATTGFDGNVTAREFPSGTVRWSRHGHAAPPKYLRYSPDGALIATCDGDGVICLWRAADGEPQGRLKASSAPVWMVDFTPDGSLLLSVSEDKFLRIWSVTELREIRSWKPAGRPIGSVRALPDGVHALVGDGIGAIDMVNIHTQARVWRAQPHTSGTLAMCLRPGGDTVATAGRDNSIALTRIADGSPVAKVSLSSSMTRFLQFNRDGSRLLASGNFRVALLDPDTLATVAPELPELPGGHAGDFSADGHWLITTAWPGAARLWDLAPRSPSRTLVRHDSGIVAFIAGTDGRELVSVSSDGLVLTHDVESGSERSRWTAPPRIQNAARSRDGRWLATTHADKTVRIFAADGSPVATLNGHTAPAGAVEFLPDGRLVTGGADKLLRIWDIPLQRQVATLGVGNMEVLGLALNRDGTMLAAWPRGAIARIWDTTALDRPATDLSVSGGCWGIDFSPDSKLLVGGKYGGTVELAGVERGSMVRTMLGHTRSVTRTLFSPDGAFIVSVGSDGLIKLWDTESGRCLATLRSEGRPTDAVFVNGHTLAVGRGSGEVDLWDLAFGDTPIAGNAAFFSNYVRQNAGNTADADRLRGWAEDTFGVSRDDPEPGARDPSEPEP